MARRAEDDGDKVLWLTLAQSWVRLAEHVADVHGDEPIAADIAGEIGEDASAESD